MISLSQLDQHFRNWNVQRKRLPLIAGALPEAIDLWVMVLQAGLDFQVALTHFIDRGPDGPLKEELAVLQAEIRTGTSRVEALRHLAAATSPRHLAGGGGASSAGARAAGRFARDDPDTDSRH